MSANQTHRVSSEHIHTYWSNAVPPVITVQPGDTVVFETLEASYGHVCRNVRELAQPGLDPELIEIIAAAAYPARSHPERDPSITGGHALTGPVAIEGAEPGDTLVVEIIDIAPAQWGYNACSPRAERLGLLNDDLGDLDHDMHWYWDLRNGDYADFKPGIRVPAGKHPGVMGVAQAEPGQLSTIPPRTNGGNMDIRHLQPGATLYLPVLAPGALFSTGDVHFAMGDGEVTGTGIEINSDVTLRFDLQKGATIPGPRLRTNGQPLSIPGAAFATTGFDPDVREAARIALRAMLDHMQREYDLTRPEAYMLASVVVDLKISQIVDRPNWTVTAYLPLSIFGE
ncbi:MAG TPA: acetamidase/formamidase family protein [Thermomicrobiales bacterium]|nr:acetamidase/formamidase family protein [Thermomicrobiales bacterium]